MARVSDAALVDFVTPDGVTPEEVATAFGLARATVMRRMRKLELAGRIGVASCVADGGYIRPGLKRSYGHDLTYHPPWPV